MVRLGVNSGRVAHMRERGGGGEGGMKGRWGREEGEREERRQRDGG